MSVTSRDIRAAHPWARFATPWQELKRITTTTWPNFNPLFSLLTLLLAMVAAYLLIGSFVGIGQRWLDDVRYGRPRTTHISGFVGHEETSNQPTHFIGLNLNRQIVVLQLPGGDANKVRTLPGPYLFGADEALTPVDLSLRDIDGDGHSDLLMTVRHEQIVYLNKEGTFRLPTASEQQQLVTTTKE